MIDWLRLPISVLALMTPGPDNCPALEAAHEGLLKSAFTCVRHFTLKLNGDLKARQVTRLTYAEGELSRETLEEQVLDKHLVLEEGTGESVLELPFHCDRLDHLEQGVLELHSSDGTETAVFMWSDENPGVLQPVSWKNNESKRFLWKKLEIEAVAEYRDFVWH